MEPAPHPPQEPWWLRATTAPLWLRVTPVALLFVGYLVAYHSVPLLADRFALRPLNLLLLVLSGALFGVRGGVGVGVALSVVNLLLYQRDGLFMGSPGRATGNLLAVGAGIVAGVVLGRARDLAMALRAEV